MNGTASLERSNTRDDVFSPTPNLYVISIGLKLLLSVTSYLTALTMVICPFPLETAVVVIVPAAGLNSTGFAMNVL